MNNGVVVLLVIVVAVLVIAALVARSHRANDGVDSFRRQIDALSPEARRPVVDQVQSAAGRNDTDGDAGDDETDDEDGVRGT